MTWICVTFRSGKQNDSSNKSMLIVDNGHANEGHIRAANYRHRFIDKNWRLIDHSLSQDSSDSPSWYAMALTTHRDVTDDAQNTFDSTRVLAWSSNFELNRSPSFRWNISHNRVCNYCLLRFYRKAHDRGPKGGVLDDRSIFKMAASITGLLKPWTPR